MIEAELYDEDGLPAVLRQCTTGSLPVTGGQALWGAQIAVALVAAGGLLVLVARRRRAPRHQ